MGPATDPTPSRHAAEAVERGAGVGHLCAAGRPVRGEPTRRRPCMRDAWGAAMHERWGRPPAVCGQGRSCWQGPAGRRGPAVAGCAAPGRASRLHCQAGAAWGRGPRGGCRRSLKEAGPSHQRECGPWGLRPGVPLLWAPPEPSRPRARQRRPRGPAQVVSTGAPPRSAAPSERRRRAAPAPRASQRAGVATPTAAPPPSPRARARARRRLRVCARTRPTSASTM